MPCPAARLGLSCSLLFAALAITSAGCTPLPMAPGSMGDLLAAMSGPEEVPEGAPAIRVEFHPAEDKPVVRRIAFTEGMTASEAIQKSHAASRFQRMNIAVLRSLGEHGQQQVMNVKWDYTKREVPVMSDYTLHNGDRLVVKEDPTTVVDELFGEVLGPVKSMF